MLKLEFLNIKKPSYWLIEDTINVGSQMRNQLVIAEENILPNHAVIKKNEDATLWLMPAVPEALVMLNGNRVNELTQLALEDELQFSGIKLRLFDPQAKSRHAANTIANQAVSQWAICAGENTNLTQQEFYIKDSLTIGRDAGADIIIDNANISRLHAILVVRYRQLWVKDLNSSNGTFVNNERITEKPLAIGDRVRVHTAEFKVIKAPGGDKEEPVIHYGENHATRIQPAISLNGKGAFVTTQPSLSAADKKPNTTSKTDPALQRRTADETTETKSVSESGKPRAAAEVKEAFISRGTMSQMTVEDSYLPPLIEDYSKRSIGVWLVIIVALLALLALTLKFMVFA